MTDPIASIGNSLGRDYMMVNGIIVAMEGDVCREFAICESTWSKAGLKNACEVINESEERRRESVRRLLIPVLKRCADHPMRCDYSDDANIALTAFLAENKEFETNNETKS